MADGPKKPGTGKTNAGWKNLHPAKPGEVRNKKGINGQPWLKSFYDFFGRERVDDVTDIETAKKMGRKVKRVIRMRNVWQAVYRQTLLGSEAAQRLVIEQMQGRARESVHLTGDGSMGGAAPAVLMLLPDDGSGDDLPDDLRPQTMAPRPDDELEADLAEPPEDDESGTPAPGDDDPTD